MKNELNLGNLEAERLKNENTEDSCLFMALYLDEELAGKKIVECEELIKVDKEIVGKKIIGVVPMLKGELTLDHDDREYSVDMLIQRKNDKLLLMTIAMPGDEIEWIENSNILKIFGKHKKTIKFGLFI